MFVVGWLLYTSIFWTVIVFHYVLCGTILSDLSTFSVTFSPHSRIQKACHVARYLDLRWLRFWDQVMTLVRSYDTDTRSVVRRTLMTVMSNANDLPSGELARVFYRWSVLQISVALDLVGLIFWSHYVRSRSHSCTYIRFAWLLRPFWSVGVAPHPRQDCRLSQAQLHHQPTISQMCLSSKSCGCCKAMSICSPVEHSCLFLKIARICLKFVGRLCLFWNCWHRPVPTCTLPDFQHLRFHEPRHPCIGWSQGSLCRAKR